MAKITCCWLYAITKYGYPPSLPDTYKVLKEMRDLGFHYIEMEGLKEANMKEVYADRNQFKAYVDELGLKVVNFCPVLPGSVSLDPKERAAALDLFKYGVETALTLGCETVQADSFTPTLQFVGEKPYGSSIKFDQQFRVAVDPHYQWERQWDALVETFTRFADLAKDAGLTLCVEPRVGELISNTDAFLRLWEHVGRDNFGIVLDFAHQHAQKEILPLSVEKLGKRIVYLHAADNDSRTNVHNAPGEGTVDWEGVFTALKKHGFNGNIGIDLGNIPDLDAKYLKTREFLMDLCGRLGIECTY